MSMKSTAESRAARRAKIAAYQRAYQEANRQALSETKRQWHEANRERIASKQKAYEQAHPEVGLSRRSNRKARKIANGGRHTRAEWRSLCAWFGNACVCCGAAGKLVVDHVVPVSKGGSDDIANIQPLCGPCNLRKHTQTIDYRDPHRMAAFLDDK